eukprot:133716-Rhodomonas_salina.1
MSMVETVNQTLLNLWCRAPTLPLIPVETWEASGEQDAAQNNGPFEDQRCNEIWSVLALQMMENYDQLADIDMLEPNQANRKQVMKNELLKPFWIDSESQRNYEAFGNGVA